MKLIVGLGNPGTRYQNTRHNAGFLVTDKLASANNTRLKRHFFAKAKTANLSILSEKVIILQPTTYMNLSGRCVSKLCKDLELNLKDLLIICDDVNLPTGKVRLRPAGSAGGHNGLASVINSLRTEDFPRLRIGVKTERPIEDLSEYVLSDFDQNEKDIVQQAITDSVAICEGWIQDGIESTMNKFN